MTSYQTTNAPEHYNDALPIHFMNATSGSGSVKSSNSLQKQIVRTNKQQQQEQDHLSQGVPSVPTKRTSEEGRRTNKTAEEVGAVLERLLALKSALPDRELKHYSAKLRSVTLSLPQAHLSSLYNILRLVVDQVDKTSAKDELVQFMMFESGVASWGTGLRRIIEGCVLSTVSSDAFESRPPSESSWVQVGKEEYQ
ncbi:hypothetical protein V1525DRAFT_456942 [Lipomyces kononenkoae]|uniref:Uncharacterized protein n=1 Tax=Lipomyces kononenkoae TaxID=34357 RepID=A0ACC3T0K0_LIPKO